MKFFAAQVSYFVRTAGRRNIRVLVRFLFVLAALVTVYSVLFHVLMEREGQKFSWVTGFYWTLTVMSTLGFGDITFESDLGRAFSILVLLSGMIFLLILLPFTFIEFFYAPWMQAQAESRAPRRLPPGTQGHVILTRYDSITRSLIRRFEQYRYRYVVIVPDLDEALKLTDEGVSAVVGDVDDPETYRKMQVQQAAMVAATGTDLINTNVAFTVRELSEEVPVFTTARSTSSIDILELAGSHSVLQLSKMMGDAVARHAIGGDAQAHVLATFQQIQIAEAGAAGTPLVGKRLAEARLRETTGVTVIGAWCRGRFTIANPDTEITEHTVLLLAASAEQLDRYNALFCIYHVATSPVVILGGGRVGRAAGRALEGRRIDFRIVEKNPAQMREDPRYVEGDAADLHVLVEAGLREAPTVLITPHEDELNIYLTIYCRRLRPDIQIVARAVLERNVATLHRAGADFVISDASMGANALFNLLKRNERTAKTGRERLQESVDVRGTSDEGQRSPDVLMVAEGLHIFKIRVPESLAGQALMQSGIREKTGCSVVGLRTGSAVEVSPDPRKPLSTADELILIGTDESQDRFHELFASTHRRRGRTA